MIDKIFKAYDVRGRIPDEINETAFKTLIHAAASLNKSRTR